MDRLVKTFIASASELQSSDLYMTVKATLFTVPEANLNGVRCTHDFLQEIVDNQDKYIGLPLCADVKNLASGRYEKLGHCYNPVTDTFHTSMIGSFYKFESVATSDDGESLVGYARILKRNKAVCKAVGDLFVEGALKFSFEIACGSYETLDDDTILIDRAENNYLEGMCIVSFPACPEAVALQLVAEIEACNKDLTKEADTMPEPVIAEAETAEAKENVTAEEAVETQTAEAQPEEEQHEETAEVVVTETHVEENTVSAYDTDTGEEAVTHEMVETTVRTIAEDKEEEKEEETEEDGGEETAQKKKECGEEKQEEKSEEIASLQTLIAELRQELDALKADVDSVRTLFAEREDKSKAVNPFMAEISQPKRFSLLDDEEDVSIKAYTLLE